MPGILPMKVIKVGTSAQSRIAQACDRCRSKKIRCDGVRPCCTQCANVGFECKTSDKLSRRAFPRGYTESLEERVRALESEVRELKDLLDEKDEKIDMLSRIHANSSHNMQMPSPRRPSTTSVGSKESRSEVVKKDEMFKVQQSPYLLNGEGSDSYFTGTSSGRTFIEAFKLKVQENGRSTADINTEKLLTSKLKHTADGPLTPTSPVVWSAPPRVVSDQLINIFFQEWAPLFPVLHRPTFLVLYAKYVADPESVTEKVEIAQLNLVFGIAMLSGSTRSSADLESFESQWKAAVDAVLKDNTMAILQTLVLAQIYCIQQGDLTRLLVYKGLSTTLSARLGLHQSQKRFALGTLTCETRKKVFWTLYAVDCFSAVVLGLPKHLKDDDVHCELPVDADDEYVTERGFQPTLPGESTKLSSALALFRAARILSKVLEEIFPAKASYELSLGRLTELSDELDNWNNTLAPHLRLQFAHDKPSTNVTGSRSPILSLVYHYTRALIQRPAICSSLGAKSSSSMLVFAGSCKHIIQIVQLLDGRGLGFSICLNRDEVLVLSGFGLLFQNLGLEPASMILKDNYKMIHATMQLLETTATSCASEFRRVAESFMVPTHTAPSPEIRQQAQTITKAKVPLLNRHNSDGLVDFPANLNIQSSTKKQLKAIASRFNVKSSSKSDVTEHRRATLHNISLHPSGVPSQSQPCLQSSTGYDAAAVSRSEPARSPLNMSSQSPLSTARRQTMAMPMQVQQQQQRLILQQQQQAKLKSRQQMHRSTNLDYLSFGTDLHQQPQMSSRHMSHPIKAEPEPTEWERLLGSLDSGPDNIHNLAYGGQNVDALLDTPTSDHYHEDYYSGSLNSNHHHKNTTTNSNNFPYASDFLALYQTESNTSSGTRFTGTDSSSNKPAPSILSFSSDDGFTNNSTDDFCCGNNPHDWNGSNGGGGGGSGRNMTTTATSTSTTADAFRGIVVPACELDFGDEAGIGIGWDAALNL